MKHLHVVIIGGVFCLCAGSLALVSDMAAQEKDKPDKRDLLAKEAAQQFLKVIITEDIDAVMKIVDVPFFLNGKGNIKDRELLKKTIQPLIGGPAPAPGEPAYKAIAVLSFGSLPEKIFGDHDYKFLKEILEKTDRLVFCLAGRHGLAIVVRVQQNKTKVIGIHSRLDGSAVLIAAQETEKGDKRTEKDREIAKETARQFLTATDAKDLDSLMKLVDVPWCLNADEKIVKDRDELKKLLKSIVVDQGQWPPAKLDLIVSYRVFREVLDQPRQKSAEQVFANDDWVVVFREVGRPDLGGCFVIRVREAKSKVIGVLR